MVAVEGLQRDGGAQRRRDHGDVHGGDQVVTLAAKVLVTLNVQVNVQVAVVPPYASPLPRRRMRAWSCTPAGTLKVSGTSSRTRLTVAFRAGGLDDGAVAVAVGAFDLLHDGTEDGLHTALHETVTGAGGAGFGLGALCGAFTVTGLTGHGGATLNGLLNTEHGVLQADGDGNQVVLPDAYGMRARAPAAPPVNMFSRSSKPPKPLNPPPG